MSALSILKNQFSKNHKKITEKQTSINNGGEIKEKVPTSIKQQS